MFQKAMILVVSVCVVMLSAVIFALSISPSPVEINVAYVSPDNYQGDVQEEISAGTAYATVLMKVAQFDVNVVAFDVFDNGRGDIEGGYVHLDSTSDVCSIETDYQGKADIRIVAYTSVQDTGSLFAYKIYTDSSYISFGVGTY
jgi:hypothetical protein